MHQAFRSLRRGFTLIEMVTVVMILGVMASGAVYSINQALRVHRQRQAADLIGTVIRGIRTNALTTEVDTTDPVYYSEGKSTRNAFSLYVCKGWVLPDPEQSNNLTDTVAQGSGTDGYDVGYSILSVNDPGYETPKRVQSPDVGFGAGSDATGSLDQVESSVSSPGELRIRQHFLNLPEGVWLRTSSSSDNTYDAAGTPLDGCEHISYDRMGHLITDVGNPSFPNAYTSPGFVGHRAYLAVIVGSGDVSTWDDGISPVYVDLRNGDAVSQLEEFENTHSNFPVFED